MWIKRKEKLSIQAFFWTVFIESGCFRFISHYSWVLSQAWQRWILLHKERNNHPFLFLFPPLVNTHAHTQQGCVTRRIHICMHKHTQALSQCCFCCRRWHTWTVSERELCVTVSCWVWHSFPPYMPRDSSIISPNAPSPQGEKAVRETSLFLREPGVCNIHLSDNIFML